MKNHSLIDERSFRLCTEIVRIIDTDSSGNCLEKARSLCRRWNKTRQEPVISEWMKILEQPWHTIREILLDQSETGKRLRQSSPFCGILSRQQRWLIYKEFTSYAKT